MKAVVPNYTFSASGKTVTLTDFTAAQPVRLDRLLMILNATRNTILYNVADSTVATAAISSNNVITLSALAGSGNADADKLTVIYDAQPGDPGNVSKLSPYGTKTNVLTTELDALASAASSVASAAYDNSTTRYPWADMILSLALQGSARSAGATVSVFMTPRTDGTNYDDANATTAELVAVFPLDAATTARVRTVRRVSLPPENVKFFALNSTGQAFAATTNVVSVRPYYDVSS